jgi:hypothetical protein
MRYGNNLVTKQAVWGGVTVSGRQSRMCRVLVAIFVLFFIVGCSSGQGPDESDALQQISSRLNVPPYFGIKTLHYVSSSEQDADHYVVSVSYDLVFNMSMADIRSAVQGSDRSAIANIDTVVAITLVYKDASAGDAFGAHKNFLFARAGEGWILQGEST